jgi:hypothetical protein
MEFIPENFQHFRRLLEKRTSINSKTGCWEYQGKNSDGYGQIMIDGVFYYTHRLSAMLFLGYIGTGSVFDVLHKCNNKCCWNPEPGHIYLGMEHNNHWDMIDAGNARNQNTDKQFCIHGHEFTEENTYWYKKPDGKMRRMCRECARIRDKETKRRKQILYMTDKKVG